MQLVHMVQYGSMVQCREGRTLVKRRTDICAEKDGHWCREGRTLVQRRTDIGACVWGIVYGVPVLIEVSAEHLPFAFVQGPVTYSDV